MTKAISVIDYGVGNVGSVVNMLKRVGARARVAADAAAIAAADALLLPGVGHFDTGMGQLRERGLTEPLQRRIRTDGIPVLGICLGMQMLADGSEEGHAAGLGWIRGHNRKLHPEKLPVPHMGWTETQCSDTTLFGAFQAPPRFYYVHSFQLVCTDATDVAGTCEYGGERVTAAVRRENVFGTQFHPEKSHRFGLEVLAGFARFAGAL